MPRYRIYWDIGYGRNEDTIEAKDAEDAVDVAYGAAREDFETQASYGLCEDQEEEDLD